MNFVLAPLVVLGSYLLGSINFGIVLSKVMAADDVRLHGSKSSGATNMLRTYGKIAGLLTLLLDMSKGLAVGAICLYLKNDWLFFASGLAVVCGHNWPIFHGFKGGKGAASALGVALIASPLISAVGVVCVALIAIFTGYMSVATLCGIAIIEILFCIFERPAYIALGACLLLLSIYKHRTNLSRLANGTENKLSFKKKDK